MGLLIHGSCVLSYAKVKRTPHLRFTPAYIALMSAVYWLLCNKWAVYCKCSLTVRLCVMYSLTCIVLAVSLMYYTFTVSKVIIMRITLHGGASNKIKNGIGSNGPNVFLFSDNKFRSSVITLHTTIAVSECPLFFSELCFHLLLLIVAIHVGPVSQPMSGWFSAHIRPVYKYIAHKR